jgi:hypothetical protein
MNPENRSIFARIPFRKLQENFETPQTSEGFMDIIDVEFEVSNQLTIDLWFLAEEFLKYSGMGVVTNLIFGENIGFKRPELFTKQLYSRTMLQTNPPNVRATSGEWITVTSNTAQLRLALSRARYL